MSTALTSLMPIFDRLRSLTYIYKTMVASISQRDACMQIRSRLDDINSFWPGDYAQFMKCH